MSAPPVKRTKIWLFGSPVAHAAAPGTANVVFEQLGMAPEYYYDRCECPTLKDAPDAPFFEIMRRPDTLAACCTMPLKFEVMPHLDRIDEQATTIGSVNTILYEAGPDGETRWIGTNNDWVGCREPIITALTNCSTPFPANLPLSFPPNQAAGFLIGAGGAIRAAALALHRLNLSPLYVVNRDPRETEALVAQLGTAFNIIALPLDVAAATQILNANKRPIVAAVGAIPSVLPVSQAEQAVYAIAAIVFAREYTPPALPTDGSYLALSPQRILSDMVYKPMMTRLRSLAESQGWHTIPGTEVSAEIVFDQVQRMCGVEVPADVREMARIRLRQTQQAPVTL